MRLLVTADLHYNISRSRPLADDVIDRMNAAGGDALLVVGDTASHDGDALERCLSRFRFPGPRLFVPGNHELWTFGPDSRAVLDEELPRRVRALGWRWLPAEPFIVGGVAVVGSVGWYDYSFANPDLGIPRRFYARKVSPGAAVRFTEMASLFNPADDIAPDAREIVARWNDGRYVKLGVPDEVFLSELLQTLESQLSSLDAKTVAAAVHHVPFAELLPPRHSNQWEFAKAYLGSGKIGDLLLKFPAVKYLFCGHSHFPAEATVRGIRAVNVGSGYRWKTFHAVDV